MEAILRPRCHNVTCRTMIFKQIPNLFLFLFRLFTVFLRWRTLHTVGVLSFYSNRTQVTFIPFIFASCVVWYSLLYGDYNTPIRGQCRRTVVRQLQYDVDGFSCRVFRNGNLANTVL